MYQDYTHLACTSLRGEVAALPPQKGGVNKATRTLLWGLPTGAQGFCRALRCTSFRGSMVKNTHRGFSENVQVRAEACSPCPAPGGRRGIKNCEFRTHSNMIWENSEFRICHALGRFWGVSQTCRFRSEMICFFSAAPYRRWAGEGYVHVSGRNLNVFGQSDMPAFQRSCSSGARPGGPATKALVKNTHGTIGALCAPPRKPDH